MKLVGKGLTAEVFEFSEDKVIKLFNKGYPLVAIKREFRNTKLINSLNINAPKAYELTKIDGRTGIVYSYVKGQQIENSFNSQENLGQLLQQFCNLQKSFYQHKKAALLSYKTYGKYLVKEKITDKKQANEYLNFIKSFPNSNTIVHGDFHPLNVLIEEDGSLKVIDFMNLMRAPLFYDVARTYFLIGTSSKEFAEVYLSAMGYKVSDISEYIELVKLYRKLEG